MNFDPRNYEEENSELSPEEEERRFREIEEYYHSEAGYRYAKTYPECIEDAEYRRELFSRYTHLDTWLLYREALPLMFCANPHYFNFVSSGISDYHSKRFPEVEAAEGFRFNVLNPDAVKFERRVLPKVFVKWARTKGWAVPLELDCLIDAQGDRNEENRYSDHKNAEHNAQKRERVLKAALAVIAHAPDKCMHQGRLRAKEIFDQIDLSSNYVFGLHEELPLSDDKIKRLISESIKLIPDR